MSSFKETMAPRSHHFQLPVATTVATVAFEVAAPVSTSNPMANPFPFSPNPTPPPLPNIFFPSLPSLPDLFL